MWVLYKKTFKGEEFVSKDIVKQSEHHKEVVEELEKLEKENCDLEVRYSIDEINTIQ